MTTPATVDCHFCEKPYPPTELKAWYLPPLFTGRAPDGDALFETVRVPICPVCRPVKLAETRSATEP